RESLMALLKDRELLILAIDEADKCPIPLAQLIRSVSTHVQHEGIKTLRFLLAGVSPFYEQMLSEDSGIARFIYKTISLAPVCPGFAPTCSRITPPLALDGNWSLINASAAPRRCGADRSWMHSLKRRCHLH